MFAVNVSIASWAARMPVLLDVAIQAARATGARLIFPATSRSTDRVARAAHRRSSTGHAVLRTRRRFARGSRPASRPPAFTTRSFVSGVLRPNVVNALIGAPFRAAATVRPVLWLGELDVTVEYVFIREARSGGARHRGRCGLRSGVIQTSKGLAGSPPASSGPR